RISKMAKLKLPSFEGGSLLRRTLLYVVTFVLGSAGFVAIASLLVVRAARPVFPARNSESSTSAAAAAAEKAAETLPTTTSTGKPSGRRGRPNKAKPPVEEDAPVAEDTH